MGFRKDFVWGAATASYQIEGEIYSVGPAGFFKEPCVWTDAAVTDCWHDGYCFVETGVMAIEDR